MDIIELLPMAAPFIIVALVLMLVFGVNRFERADHRDQEQEA